MDGKKENILSFEHVPQTILSILLEYFKNIDEYLSLNDINKAQIETHRAIQHIEYFKILSNYHVKKENI